MHILDTKRDCFAGDPSDGSQSKSNGAQDDGWA